MKRINYNSGFTLIELMIVIAIIWVLAVTLIPQLTWAQARARDTWRISSLKNISAVLETYYSDESEYPAITHSAPTAANWCLSADDKWTVTSELSDMFKWGKSPFDPQKNSLAWPCLTPGSYWYLTLERWWIAQNGYVLIAAMETYKKANMDYSKSGLEAATLPTYNELIDNANTWVNLTSDTTVASDSVFAETN